MDKILVQYYNIVVGLVIVIILLVVSLLIATRCAIDAHTRLRATEQAARELATDLVRCQRNNHSIEPYEGPIRRGM